MDIQTKDIETERLNALRKYNILYTEPEKDLDAITRLASFLCKTPFAFITFVDEHRQWFKSHEGLNITELPREISFCKHTILTDSVLEVEDVIEDERFSSFPYVLNSPSIRFYAGAPLITPEGHRIGSICVLDNVPRVLNHEQRAGLTILAKEVISFLEISKDNIKMQELLIKADEFKELFDSSSELHCVLNDDGDISYINDSVNQILGYTPEEVFGANIWNFCLPSDLGKLSAEINENLELGRNQFEIETRVLTKSGEVKWLCWSTTIKDGRWLIHGRDINERKIAEAKIENLSLALEKSSAGVLIRNADNHIIWVNDALQDILGYTIDELRDKSFADLLAESDADASTLENVLRIAKVQRHYEIEVQSYKKGGHPVWLLISNNPILDEQGNVERQVAVIVDISGRKKAEQELIGTREDAIKLSKAKEGLLSVLSHEMRTPLNAVIGISRLLEEDNPAEHQLEYLDILKFSSENLLNLINDILDFTKIETGNLELETTSVDFKRLGNQIIHSLKYKASEKNIQLNQYIDPAIPALIMGDQTRLYQIMTNLLGNAIKFTDKGEVGLKLLLEDEDADSVNIYFEISDTGIGIPPNKTRSIFEAYTQAGSDTTRKYGGTGLGLTITKNLVELYNSTIFVKSEVNRGTTFYFTIRFSKVKKNRSDIQPDTDVISMPSTVLIVDDNSLNRLIAGKVLNKWDIKTEFAENGQEALDKIGKNEYDLVFMDIHMPVMDGIEATKAIRLHEDDKKRNIPVIALTASVFSKEAEDFKSIGMNDYVLKPFSANDIFQKIKPYLLKQKV